MPVLTLDGEIAGDIVIVTPNTGDESHVDIACGDAKGDPFAGGCIGTGGMPAGAVNRDADCSDDAVGGFEHLAGEGLGVRVGEAAVGVDLSPIFFDRLAELGALGAIA